MSAAARNIPKKKNKRITSVRVEKDEVEGRIKGSRSPFRRNQSFPSTSLSTSKVDTFPSPGQIVTISRGSTRNPCKPPSHFQADQRRRACERWDQLNTNPRQTSSKAKNTNLKTFAKNSNPPPFISYNRFILDYFEKERYSHPKYEYEGHVSVETSDKAHQKKYP